MSILTDTIRKQFKEGDDIRDEGLTTPDTVQRFDNILYGDDSEWNTMDLYIPKEEKEKLPIIISFHGGGWVYGDKERYQYYCMSLAEEVLRSLTLLIVSHQNSNILHLLKI